MGGSIFVQKFANCYLAEFSFMAISNSLVIVCACAVIAMCAVARVQSNPCYSILEEYNIIVQGFYLTELSHQLVRGWVGIILMEGVIAGII